MSALKRLARRQLERRGWQRQRATPPAGPPLGLDDEILATMEAVAPYTLTGPERVAALVDAVRYVVRANVPGALAECGVWRGGSALAVLRTLTELGVTDRDVWLYDTFTAMPAPTDEDVDVFGVSAATMHAEYAADPSVLDPAYDYLPLPDVRALLLSTGYPEERVHFVQGLVEDTIPEHAPEQLALLRLDTDYYSSTRHELEHLAPRLTPGSVLIVDDYGHWRGSQQAVDEWTATLPHPLLLQRIDYTARLAVMPGDLVSAQDRLRVWREEPLKRVALEARLLRLRRLRQFQEFGANSVLHRPLWLYGTRHAAIGDYCLLLHGAWLSVERTAWDQPEPALRIGNRVTLRPFVSISAGLSVTLEDGVSIGTGSGIYDSNHVVRHDASVLDAGASTYEAVRIGSGSWLGDRVTVLAGAVIGAGCTIGAGSVVRGVIPDHSVAVGAPARVVGHKPPGG